MDWGPGAQHAGGVVACAGWLPGQARRWAVGDLAELAGPKKEETKRTGTGVTQGHPGVKLESSNTTLHTRPVCPLVPGVPSPVPQPASSCSAAALLMHTTTVPPLSSLPSVCMSGPARHVPRTTHFSCSLPPSTPSKPTHTHPTQPILAALHSGSGADDSPCSRERVLF